MPESMERANENQAPEVESRPAATSRTSRWTRAHTIWTLMIVSLIPGVVIASFRNHWEDLPNVVQIATYAACAIIIMVAVGLIIAPRDEED
jgi:hypothetical protein